MNAKDLKTALEAELAQHFSGWDFSRLDGRMIEDSLPWDYRTIVESAIPESRAMLDMGTGGGEFLDSLVMLPSRTCATEGYKPNIEIARSRLANRGVELREIEADHRVPFEDGAFDLIVNRHESFAVDEIRRLLADGGIFVTQQVGSLNDADLNLSLGAAFPDYDWCLARAETELVCEDLEIESGEEHIGKTRFTDIGAVVYYLKCIPWQIDDFSIEDYFDRLSWLARRIEKRGFAEFILHRFIVSVRKHA